VAGKRHIALVPSWKFASRLATTAIEAVEAVNSSSLRETITVQIATLTWRFCNSRKSAELSVLSAKRTTNWPSLFVVAEPVPERRRSRPSNGSEG
jgi:hypothetical protein